MNIVISGASGFIGTALSNYLNALGHRVFPLVRDGHGPFYWQPDREILHFDASIPVDAVVHLAGPNIANKRWSEQRKRLLVNARVDGTRLMSTYLAAMDKPPAVFICASAIGYYGDRGQEPVDEDSGPGSGFAAELCQRWEVATYLAAQAGIRTVTIRTGIVLAGHGGALAKMLPAFKWGLGGPMGSGKQYMSWVSMADVVRMIAFILQNEGFQGAVNLVSPSPVTNEAFSRELGAALGRPAKLRMPVMLARLLFGDMAQELLLSGAAVLPKRLQAHGYQYVHSDLRFFFREILEK